MAVLGTATAIIDLDISGLMSKAGQAEGALNKLGSTSGKGLDTFSGKINRVSGEIATVGKSLLGFGAIIGVGFGFATKSAINFEAQMSAVQSVSGATGGDIDKLRQEALRLGKDTSFSASESAQAMEIMIKAGASLPDVLSGATEQVLNLANATGTAVPLAAETASAAVNVFKTDYTTAANVIAQSANASAIDVNDWALAIKSVGPVAAQSNMSIEDLGATMVILGDAGIKGEVGATALRNILLSLGDSTDDGTQALAGYGVATRDASGEMRNLNDITKDLVPVWNELDDAQKQTLATQIAGKDGYAAFMVIMEAQTKAVKNNSTALDDAKKRMDGTGTAAEQAAVRMNNLKGAWEQFTGSLETLAINIGSTLLPALKAIVDVGTGLLNFILAIPAPITTAIAALVGLAGVLAAAAGAFMLILPRVLEFQRAMAVLRTAGLFAGLTGAVPIILAVAAAIGALYVAYRTNFLGIGDGIDAVVGKIKGFGSAIGNTFSGLMAGISNFANNFKAAWAVFDPKSGVMAGINGAVGMVNSGFSKVVSPLQGVTDAVKGLLSPLKAMTAPIKAVADGFSSMTTPLISVGGSLSSLSNTFANVAGPLDNVAGSVTRVIGPITTLQRFILSLAMAFRMIGGGNLGWANAIADVLENLSWSAGILEKDFTALGNALGLFGAGLGSLLSGDWAKAVDEFGKAWGNTGKALKRLGVDLKKFGGQAVGVLRNVAAKGFAELGLAAHNVFTNIGNSLIDIGKLFPAIQGPLTAIGNGFKLFGATAYNALTGIADFLKGDIPAAMTRFRLAFAQGLESVTQIGSGLLGLAATFGNWVLEVGAPTIIGWLKDAAVDAWPYISAAAGWVGGVIAELGGWVLNVGAPAAINWLWDIAGAATSWVAEQIAGIDWSGVWTDIKIAGSVIVEVAVKILEAAGGAIASAYTSGKEWLIEKYPWLAPVIDGTEEYFGNVVARIGARIDTAMDVLGPVYATVRDWLVAQVPWLQGVLGGEVNETGNVKVSINILEGTGLESALNSVSDAEHYVVSKVPWLSTVLYGTGSVNGDIKVLIGIAEDPVGAVQGAFSGITSAEDYVKNKVPWLGTILDGTGSVSGDIQVLISVAEVAGGFAQSAFAGVQSAEDYVIAKVPWLGTILKGTGSVSGDLQVLINIISDPLSLVGGAFDGINSAEDWVKQQLPWLGSILEGSGSVSGDLKITLGLATDAAGALGDLAAFVWPDLPEFPDWPDFPDFSWPDFPTFSWPDIPAPSWLPSFLGGGGDKPPLTDEQKKVPGGGGSAAKMFGKFDSGYKSETVTTTFTQVGGEQVAAVAMLVSMAVASVPDLKTTTLTQIGGETVVATSTAASAAINAIPQTHTSSITQSGAESVATSSNAATLAINAIPQAHTTAITEAGGAEVTGSANAAAAAINAIPESHHTTISLAGEGAVISAANAAAAAVNAIPSSKTVSVSIVSNGVVAMAKGGVVPRDTTVARLAERGPELFRNPSGSWGMAMQDSLYPMTPGARVFTAAQTKRMLRTWNGPAYANGGRVATPTRASMSNGGNTYNSGSPVTVHAQIHTQGRMDDGEKRQFVQEIATSFRDGINLVHMGKGGS